MRLSVVIPVYNDAEPLSELLYRLHDMARNQTLELETIFVDSASTDTTWETLLELKINNPNHTVTLIRLKRNIGQHYSTWLGLMHCHYEWLVTMDADLQHPPEEIPKLLTMLQQREADLVYGTATAGHGTAKQLSSYLFWLFNHPVGTKKSETKGSGFRAMTKEIFDKAKGENHLFASIDTPFQACARHVETVNTLHMARTSGRTHYTTLNRITLALRFMIKKDRTFTMWGMLSCILVALSSLVCVFGSLDTRWNTMLTIATSALTLCIALAYQYEKHSMTKLTQEILEVLR
jgi:undecaprenyl-phosphate 4-deoxy-4-formamido-L-arabinose transferase